MDSGDTGVDIRKKVGQERGNDLLGYRSSPSCRKKSPLFSLSIGVGILGVSPRGFRTTILPGASVLLS